MKALDTLFNEVTQKIITQLEAGVRPWERPWLTGAGNGLPLRANGINYQGINILLLWLESLEKGFNSPFWLTFKQAKALGAKIKKGAKSSQVIYASKFSATITNDQNEEETRHIPFLKTYRVFNADQIEALPAHFHPTIIPQLDPADRITHAEQFFANTSADIRHGGDCACYVPSLDFIQLPKFEHFKSTEGYYGTLAHEMVHWTGHKSRLDRLNSKSKFGDKTYAFEELVAEIGSAFLSSHLNITPDFREDHTSYIAHWLKALKDDNRLILKAASQAQKAVNYLQNCDGEGESPSRHFEWQVTLRIIN